MPSQEGFGTDLMAQNVIVPIIDLTSAAEGSTVGQNLQTAISFDSQTSTQVYNTTSTLVNNTGFFRIFGAIGNGATATVAGIADLSITDGLSTKIIFKTQALGTGSAQTTQIVPFDFVIFLQSGESLTGTTNTESIMNVTTRQIADVNGVLVNPAGFTPQ